MGGSFWFHGIRSLLVSSEKIDISLLQGLSK